MKVIAKNLSIKLFFYVFGFERCNLNRKTIRNSMGEVLHYKITFSQILIDLLWMEKGIKTL